MAGIRMNLLWTLIGLPLGIASLIYYIFSRSKNVQLKDKVVFITGASSGLGEACAEAFYKAGCKLILSGRKVQKLMELKARLVNLQASHSPAIVTIDLENLESIPGKINQVAAAFGHVDILINNAGMSYRGKAAETILEVNKKLMNVNFFGHTEVTKAVIPHMIRQKSGHIVAISSVQGRIAIPFRSAYAASKHALHAYFDSLRAELSLHNITVSVVSPYYIKTNLSTNAITGDGKNYGTMDKNTEQGWKPDYVASRIVDCVKHQTSEVVLAPFHVQLAFALRALTPWLYFKLMRSRAKKEIQGMN